ncbi:hypothetical protein HUU53_03200 [Candidatus Micrarchaeota archaeon]|nr:hypothetical protein [Candidatus Micrarchaeota archaeon]
MKAVLALSLFALQVSAAIIATPSTTPRIPAPNQEYNLGIAFGGIVALALIGWLYSSRRVQ